MAQHESSIVFKAYDQISGSLRSMEDQAEGLSKEWEIQQKQLRQLGDRYKDFNRRTAETKSKIIETKKAMDEAAKAFKATGDEADRTNFENLQMEYRELTDAAKAYQDAAAQTRRAMKDTADTARRTSMGAGGPSAPGGVPGGGSEPGLAAALGQAGAYNVVGQVAGQWAQALAGSIAGDTGGTLFGGALSGAGSGAAIGTMIAPGIGTAVGAVLGGVAGLAGAGAQVYEKRDDSFKGYVQEAVTTQLAAQEQSKTAGSALAAGREMDLISLGTLYGSEEKAAAYMEQLVEMANSTPFLYQDLVGLSKAMAPYGWDDTNTLPDLTTIGDAGAALGWQSADMATVAAALGRMKSTGKTSLEYINQLQERGVDATGALGASLGVDQGTVYDMISKGKINGTDAARIILEAMTEDFAGAMVRQAETFGGLSSTMEGLNQELDAAMGAGYNEERKKGMEAQIEWLNGTMGEDMAEANAAIGAFKAQLENTKEEILRNSIEETMESDAYKTAEAEGDAAEMGRLIMGAKIHAQNLYNETEGAQTMLASEKALIEAVQADTETNELYWNAGYLRGEWYSKGLAAGYIENIPGGISGPVPVGGNVYLDRYQQMYPHAAGLNLVPYDGYPALLHQGERVLTAEEARRADRGTGVTINIAGMTIREEADIDKVARAICEELSRAAQVRGD